MAAAADGSRHGSEAASDQNAAGSSGAGGPDRDVVAGGPLGDAAGGPLGDAAGGPLGDAAGGGYGDRNDGCGAGLCGAPTG
jgi:hypothetical protein